MLLSSSFLSAVRLPFKVFPDLSDPALYRPLPLYTVSLMYVPTNLGQLLAFAAKVAEALIIPQLTAYISLYSSRRAIQIGFFSSLGNVVSILTDPRSWTHKRNIPVLPTYISITSWSLMVASMCLWLMINVSDLLVFQLSPTKNIYTFKLDSSLNTSFLASEVTAGPGSTSNTSDANLYAPTVLLNTTAAELAFQNNTYIPSENYSYLNDTPQVFENVSDYTFISENYVNGSDGYSYLTGQLSSFETALYAYPGNYAICSNNSLLDDVANPIKVGFNKASLVQAYQVDDDAYFAITSTKQRVSQSYKESTKRPKTLKGNLDVLTLNYTQINQFINETSTDLNMTEAYEYLSGWKTTADTLTFSALYYEITTDIPYDKTPRYTINYLVVGVWIVGSQASSGDTSTNNYARYLSAGHTYYTYFEYTSRNVHVKNATINPKYLPDGRVSPIIITDASDEQMILAMLKDPKPPLLVQQVSMMDAWPAVILIFGSLGVSFVLFLLVRVHHVIGGRARGVLQHFDAYLEICHKAVDDFQHHSADNLLVKMQETDLVMVDGYCPASGGNKIGLVPRNLEMVPFDEKATYT